MRSVRLDEVSDSIERGLQLFDRSYSSVAPGIGGWYHRLEMKTPGPSATAVALHSYLEAGRRPDRLTEALAFLRSRQVLSEHGQLNGGWPVNTSNGRPVLEATSLVLRLLSSGRILIGDGIPEVSAAIQWVLNNQNEDGGWGSFFGQASRVWLTAMAIRSLTEINIANPAIVSGADWLIRSRDPISFGWGEQAGSSATVTHTSFVLSCLVETRLDSIRPDVADAVNRAFRWLAKNVDVGLLFDDAARVESYNISYTEDSQTTTWQNSVWHPGLPFALQALVRDPAGADLRIIESATRCIIQAQSIDGRWPNLDGAEGISVWSVWPFLISLCDLRRIVSLPGGTSLTPLSSDSLLLRRAADESRSMTRLWLRSNLSATVPFMKRRWSAILLLATFLAALVLWITGVLDVKDSALTLVLPVLLLFIQEIVVRSHPPH